MFSIIALEFFKLQPEQNGYLMAYFGIVQMVIQGGVIGRLTARFSENSLLNLSIAVAALVGLAQAYMQNVFQFCVTVVPMMFSLSVFNVITDSILTKSVPSSDTGTMLGLCASVQSLLRTVGPTVGGFLYVNFGVSSIGFIQFVVNAAVFMFLLLRPHKKTSEEKK
ncbi:solute carrier family 22 member 18-like [Sphaeramia orbicularis]|nr:solute carrier family 22 member 18-like [Sphaeramia orbicularis]